MEKVSRKSGQMCLSGMQGNGGANRGEFSKGRRQEKAIIVTTSACMLLIPSRILQAHGGQHRRRGLDSEAASEIIVLSHERGKRT